MKKRAMKKWIPADIYCDHCPWWELIWRDTTEQVSDPNLDYSMYYNPEETKKMFEEFAEHPYKHRREECQFREYCTHDCETCKEMVSHCKYLNYTEYGQYPLGDGCKVCGVRDYFTDDIKQVKINKGNKSQHLGKR